MYGNHYRCRHEDAGIISLKSGRPRYVCLNHKDEFIADIPKCENCAMSKPSINWFNNGLRKCKMCKKRLCKKCNQNDHGCKAATKKKRIQNDEIQRRDGFDDENGVFNDDINFVKDDWWYHTWNGKNHSKKASRKSMKNKNKLSAYWKRQRDKDGMVKYKKRSNQRKMHSIMMKNEM